MIRTLEMMAALVADAGQAAKAVQLLAAATRLRETTGYAILLISRGEYRHLSERLRSTLGDNRYAGEWAEGRMKSLDEAIALALDANSPPGSASTT